jgi:endoglucanase
LSHWALWYFYGACLTHSTFTKVALDYNSPLVTLAAYSILNLPSTEPYYATLSAGTYSAPSGQPCDAVFPCRGKKRLRSAYIIAIAFSLFALVLAFALFGAWRWLGWFRKNK